MLFRSVGRKTANVIVSVIYNQPAMAVDTHVFRVSHRMGLVAKKAKTPLAVEKELIKYIPKVSVPVAHHWLILHGRYVCVARSPKCGECALKEFCKYFEALERKEKKRAMSHEKLLLTAQTSNLTPKND